ncbi:phosphate ABC transporter substrate-binding/OmpA family protein [Aestuariivita sp.]|jgi:phosphate transport system substrate-binding protein|uniref:phosphate ABC transporter substrate-binding/OmpA family protein n=1 Tax=Aestuariivita sp. TaxID=1872407 RepID=UPI00216FDFFA|nr:phosphate ABC transporter substrate-binding/OmpA family protein [Aestuariivita sp.]MCE8005463.1 OmpA family protein [Aestuariivita sp.]
MFGFKGAAIFAALLLCLAPFATAAQDVTLTSPDGGVEISGTLLGFDGEFYRVDTIYGELTVDGSGVSCDGPGCPNLIDFVAEVDFSGSSTMGEALMPALLEGFALRNGLRVSRQPGEGTRVDYTLRDGQTGKVVARFGFRITTTDEGFADLLADEADVVMALREIRSEERTRARNAGMGDMTDRNRSRVLALDAMVPIVAPGNPVKAISMPELAAAFSGQITNWSELGGPDAPITLHLPDAGSGLAQAVEDRLLRPEALTLPEGVVRHRLSSALSRTVTTDPFGLGLVSYAEVGNARMLTLSGSCGFTLQATRRTIKTEDYPLTSPMFLYLPARRLPKLAREFLSYMRGPAAQIVIRRVGFVDQSPEEITINRQGDRFANAISAAGDEVTLSELRRMVGTLRPMVRLTTSFRFEAGSSRLDAQSRSNIEQLARAIEAGVYDARSLSFIGFSDGDGPSVANLAIARRRAEAVRDAVLAAAETVNPDRVALQVEAYGEALPMACDDSAWGRQVNRRVEVWLR